MDDPQQANVNEDDGWEFVNLGDQQKFGIKTAGLEDKSTACQMLVHYARELKEGFVDYTEQVINYFFFISSYLHSIHTAVLHSLQDCLRFCLPFLLF